MKRIPLILQTTRGFTLTELMVVVTILGLIVSIVTVSYESFTARARYSKVEADMDQIAHAGYVDYTNNLGVWDISPNPWTPPPGITQMLEQWPVPSCPGYYYSWDNGAIFGLNVVRVSLRRASDESSLWSYCVNTFGGGDCQATDIYGGTSVEITSADIGHFYCNE
jgi:prepilin-type N-terminal cleavage/methylation domain-containing protein